MLFCIIGFLQAESHSQSTFGDWTYLDNGSDITILGYTGQGGNITIPSQINSKPVTTIGHPQLSASIFQGNTSQILNVIVPDSVKYISARAFDGSNLISINLPNSIVSIGPRAFEACQFLNNVIIPAAVPQLDYKTFAYCSSLVSVSLPQSLMVIDREVFKGCSSLQSIILPNQLISIGENAFFDCSSLTSIIIPNNVTTLGNRVFENCTNLTNVIIGSNVNSISSTLRPFFGGCEKLISIEVHQDNTAFESVDGVLYQKSPSMIYEFPPAKGPNYSIVSGTLEINSHAFFGSKKLTNLIIPSSVGKIGRAAFADSSILSTFLPNSVTNIGTMTFSSSKIKNIVIGGGINSIPSQMFAWCSQLESIYIPSNILSIGFMAFAGAGLKSIKIENGLQLISNNAFEGTTLRSITFPSTLSNIGNEAFKGVPPNASFIFEGFPPTLGSNVFNLSFSGGAQSKVFFSSSHSSWNTIFGGLSTFPYEAQDLKPIILNVSRTNSSLKITWTCGIKEKYNGNLSSTVLSTTDLLNGNWNTNSFQTDTYEYIDSDSSSSRKFFKISSP